MLMTIKSNLLFYVNTLLQLILHVSFYRISPLIRKLASLEFAPRKKHVQVIKQDALKEIQRHNLDHASMEATSKFD